MKRLGRKRKGTSSNESGGDGPSQNALNSRRSGGIENKRKSKKKRANTKKGYLEGTLIKIIYKEYERLAMVDDLLSNGNFVITFKDHESTSVEVQLMPGAYKQISNEEYDKLKAEPRKKVKLAKLFPPADGLLNAPEKGRNPGRNFNNGQAFGQFIYVMWPIDQRFYLGLVIGCTVNKKCSYHKIYYMNERCTELVDFKFRSFYYVDSPRMTMRISENFYTYIGRIVIRTDQKSR